MSYQELPPAYDAPTEGVYEFTTQTARVASERPVRWVVADVWTPSGDLSATHGKDPEKQIPTVVKVAELEVGEQGRATLREIDDLSAQFGDRDFILRLHLPAGTADSSPGSTYTPEQLALVSAMVRPCDYVVLVASAGDIDPYFWKTDGGIPPRKLIIDWTDPAALGRAEKHGLAGFATANPAQSMAARAHFGPWNFVVDRAALERRRDRFRNDHGPRPVPGRGVGMDPARNNRRGARGAKGGRAAQPAVGGKDSRDLAKARKGPLGGMYRRGKGFCPRLGFARFSEEDGLLAVKGRLVPGNKARVGPRHRVGRPVKPGRVYNHKAAAPNLRRRLH